MNVVKFVKYFDSIKPTLEEIKDVTPSISIDSAVELSKDFDLRIMSLNLNEDPIMDLVENTNICDTGFSTFHFYNSSSMNQILKIGMIEEKGYIFFNQNTKLITFKELEFSSYNFVNQPIDQRDFLEFYLKYLESNFNRIFRKNAKALKFIDDIELDIGVIKKFEVFRELLSEIGIQIEV